MLIGEGTGVVVLKRLADAERDGDRVYAVIRGTGVASDGRSRQPGQPGPAAARSRAVRQAWAAAGLDPRRARLDRAAGGARHRDPGRRRGRTGHRWPRCSGPADPAERAVIGSVKSMIGHTMPAAGVAGLVKAALAVHHGVLPPTLHCDDPHPALAATRFRTLSTPPGRGSARACAGPASTRSASAASTPTWCWSKAVDRGRSVCVRRAVVAGSRSGCWLAADARALAALLAADDSPCSPPLTARGRRAGPAGSASSTRPASGSRWPAGGRQGPGLARPQRRVVHRRAAARRRAAGSWRSSSPAWRPSSSRRCRRHRRALRAAGWWPRSTTPQVGDVGRHGTGVLRARPAAGHRAAPAGHRPGRVWPGTASASGPRWPCGGIYAADAVDAFLAHFDPDALRVPGLAFAVLGTSADVGARRAGRRATDVVLSHDNAPNQSMVCGPGPPSTSSSSGCARAA